MRLGRMKSGYPERYLLLALALVVAGCAPGLRTQDVTVNTNPWNGYKVYLSSPTHVNSGERGECGWEENANGNLWNSNAAVNDKTPGASDLYGRGYRVTVSESKREGLYTVHRDAADNWGANVYLITHTNASTPCHASASYFLVMFRSGVATSQGLAYQMVLKMDPVAPGGWNSWDCDTQYECGANAPYRAYVELFFHTNQNDVNWFQNGYASKDDPSRLDSWRYGYAVDDLLGYPPNM